MLRWGVLGTAGIARSQVVPAIQGSSNGRVTAVASRDPERSAEFAAAFGIDNVFASYEALLASPNVDAVYIPLPNAMHAEWAIRAADAGKAVLCEKPLALNAAEARRVADRFAAGNVPLMEGFMYRFHPQNVHALKLVREGAVGDVREVRAHLSVDIMADAAGNVRFDKTLGGGSLLDMGCYAVNAARRFLGEPVAAMAWFDLDPAAGIDLAATAILEFPDDRVDVPRAFIPGLGSRVAEGLVVVSDPDGRRSETLFEPANHYRLMAEAFADAVLSGEPVPYPPEDAVQNMRALDAIAASALSGRRVEIRDK